jgi:hypothetical protein
MDLFCEVDCLVGPQLGVED